MFYKSSEDKTYKTLLPSPTITVKIAKEKNTVEIRNYILTEFESLCTPIVLLCTPTASLSTSKRLQYGKIIMVISP